jgi:hypothetical protein
MTVWNPSELQQWVITRYHDDKTLRTVVTSQLRKRSVHILQCPFNGQLQFVTNNQRLNSISRNRRIHRFHFQILAIFFL